MKSVTSSEGNQLHLSVPIEVTTRNGSVDITMQSVFVIALEERNTPVEHTKEGVVPQLGISVQKEIDVTSFECHNGTKEVCEEIKSDL